MAKTFIVETSARHVHLAEADFKVLFGENATLTKKKDLSQPGQYACEERVTVKGTKKDLPGVSILGPFRKESQVELSATDARSIGLGIAIRESGVLDGTPGCTLVGPCGEVTLEKGVIVAKRHIHMTPLEASRARVRDNDEVFVITESYERGLIFADVVVRVSPSFKLAMHVDTDEANAVLAGDALLTFAPQIIIEKTQGLACDVVLKLVHEYTKFAGAYALIAGQVVDIESEDGKLTKSAEETLDFIHSLGNFGLPAGLDRIKKVLEILGNPQNDFKSIHIAGTNGKGSVTAFVSSIFKEAGYKTGSFISPYIIDFRKRILSDTTRQDSLVELQTELRNLPYLFDAKIYFNNTLDPVTYEGIEIPPYYMVVFYSGEAKDEIAEIIAKRSIFPTLQTANSVELSYLSDVFVSGAYSVFIQPFFEEEYNANVTFHIDTTFITSTSAQEKILTALYLKLNQRIHRDYIKEADLYNIIENLNLAGVELLNVDLLQGGVAVPYIQVPLSRIPKLVNVTFTERFSDIYEVNSTDFMSESYRTL